MPYRDTFKVSTSRLFSNFGGGQIKSISSLGFAFTSLIAFSGKDSVGDRAEIQSDKNLLWKSVRAR